MARKHANPGAKENAATRRLLALDFRKRGMSYLDIGKKLDISDAQAYRDVQAALQALSKLELESAEELRQMEIERLDMLLNALTPYMLAGNVGHVLAFLKVSESRRKLLGLDAPVKTDLTSGGEKLALPIVFLPQVNDDND